MGGEHNRAVVTADCEPVSTQSRSQHKGKRKRGGASQPAPAAVPLEPWVPHAIDEPVHDETVEKVHGAGLFHAVLSTSATSAEPDHDGAVTQWWRFYPDTLSPTPEGAGQSAGSELGENADEVVLLTAANNDRTQWSRIEYDWARLTAPDGAVPAPARPMVDHDEGDDDADREPELRPEQARNDNELFLFRETLWFHTRLPLPPASLDLNTFLCLESAILADVTPRVVPAVLVTRPAISDDNHFTYAFAPLVEYKLYARPDSATLTDDELNRLTVADFAELEARDPYAQRIKRVQYRAEHATYGEKVNDNGLAVSPVVIRRTLLNELMLVLNKDAHWRHDGDWPEEKGLNSHQDSYATGRLLLVSTGGNLLKVWTSELNQYYRVVLRSIQGQTYYPPNLTPGPAGGAFGPPPSSYPYEINIYARLDKINTALRNGISIPYFRDFFLRLVRTLETRAARTKPRFYIPDTLEAGDAAAPTPLGLQIDLYDYQQRSLAWLLKLERSQRARTISVHQFTYATPGAQKSQFQACGQLGVADWVQLGPGGMFVNVSNCAIAADSCVWHDRLLPLSEIECLGALEVSRMGAGKTIVALALVAAHPFRSVRDMPWAGIDPTQYFVSRATLVVLRSDLVAQWGAEALRVLPEGAKIVSMATIRDYREVSWNDMLLADVVIVSLSFLQNNNYQARIAKLVKTRRGRYCLPRAAYEDPPEGPHLLGFPARWAHWRHAPNPDDYEHVNAQIDAHMAALHARGRALFGTDTNCIILERIYWHRLVIDELHELSHVQCAVGSPPTTTRVAETLLFTLHARFQLGLTGTPPIAHAKSIAALAEAVGVRNVPTRAMDAQAWLTSHVRRNHPDLHVPRVHYRTQWVDLTPAEHGLMASFQGHGVRAQLMMCNHHQIEDEVVAAAGETAKSVDEVAARVQGARMDRMEALVVRGRRQQTELAAQVGRMRALIEIVPPKVLADLPKSTGLSMAADRRLVALDIKVETLLTWSMTIPGVPGADADVYELVAVPVVDVSQSKDLPADAVATARRIVQMCADLVELQAQLQSVAAQFRFMTTVLAAIRDADAQTCPVCLENVLRGQPIVITRCGHVFCVACAEAMLAQPVHLCAVCRGDLAVSGATIRMVMQRDANRDDDAVMDDNDQDNDDLGIDYAKYGSKIKALVQFVRRVVRTDATAKLILFSQFHQLTALMAQAFSEFGIGHAKLMGGHVIAKQRAIARFRHDPDTKVLFLSAEDSVSGLQLIEANHVVIVHPFLGASEAMARAYEMQGCARAIRAGQTREVTVTRFVTRGTIEEELTARRSDLRDGE